MLQDLASVTVLQGKKGVSEVLLYFGDIIKGILERLKGNHMSI